MAGSGCSAQVEIVAQLIYQEESPDPSRLAGPGLAEARGAQQVNQENKTVSRKLSIVNNSLTIILSCIVLIVIV